MSIFNSQVENIPVQKKQIKRQDGKKTEKTLWHGNQWKTMFQGQSGHQH